MNQEFSLQILELDAVVAKRIGVFDDPSTQSEYCYNANPELITRVPTVRVFGATQQGQSTCMHVHGYFPYLYVRVPPALASGGSAPSSLSVSTASGENGFTAGEREYARDMCAFLEKRLAVMRQNSSKAVIVYRAQLVIRRHFFGYEPIPCTFLRIDFTTASHVRNAADLLRSVNVTPYEAHIPYLLHFLIDHHLYGMDFLTCTHYQFRQYLPDSYGMDAKWQEVLATNQHYSKKRKIDTLKPGVYTHAWRVAGAPTNDGYIQSRGVTRVSTCDLEVDIFAHHITNKTRLHTNVNIASLLHDVDVDTKLVSSLKGIWSEEQERLRVSQEGKDMTQKSFSFRYSNRPEIATKQEFSETQKIIAKALETLENGAVSESMKAALAEINADEKTRSPSSSLHIPASSQDLQAFFTQPSQLTQQGGSESPELTLSPYPSSSFSQDGTPGEEIVVASQVLSSDIPTPSQILSQPGVSGHDDGYSSAHDDEMEEMGDEFDDMDEANMTQAALEESVYGAVDDDDDDDDDDEKGDVEANMTQAALEESVYGLGEAEAMNEESVWRDESVLAAMDGDNENHDGKSRKVPLRIVAEGWSHRNHEKKYQLLLVDEKSREEEVKWIRASKFASDNKKWLIDVWHNKSASNISNTNHQQPTKLVPVEPVSAVSLQMLDGDNDSQGNHDPDTLFGGLSPVRHIVSSEDDEPELILPSEPLVTWSLVRDGKQDGLVQMIANPPPKVDLEEKYGYAYTEHPPAFFSDQADYVALQKRHHMGALARHEKLPKPPSHVVSISSSLKQSKFRSLEDGNIVLEPRIAPPHPQLIWLEEERKNLTMSLTPPPLVSPILSMEPSYRPASPKYDDQASLWDSSFGQGASVEDGSQDDDGVDARYASQYGSVDASNSSVEPTPVKGINMGGASALTAITGPSEKTPSPFFAPPMKPPTEKATAYNATLMSMECCARTVSRKPNDPMCEHLSPHPLQNELVAIIFVLVQIGHMHAFPFRTCILIVGAKPNVQQVSPAKLGAVEYCYVDNEVDLLLHFQKCVRVLDPDIMMGYETQNNSFGYVLERAKHLCKSGHAELTDYGFDRAQGIFRPSPVDESDEKDDPTRHAQERYAQRKGLDVKFVGRVLLNIWRIMRKDLKLHEYSFSNAVAKVLKQRTPLYSWRTLTTWFDSPDQTNGVFRLGNYRHKTLCYFATRAQLNLSLLFQLDVIHTNSEVARVYGIKFYDVFFRGSQYRVESMLARLTTTLHFVMPSYGSMRVTQQRPLQETPLNMEPHSKFYTNPVVVLDFQSLYPSQMIAYNLCYSTCLGSLEDLERLARGDTPGAPSGFQLGPSDYQLDVASITALNEQNMIWVSPNKMMFVRAKERAGVVPRMLTEILSTRVLVKGNMKLPSVRARENKRLYQLLNARQFALKMLSNVTYGYTSASFSGRMPCAELADTIVRTGRRTLERGIAWVEKTIPGAKVRYGDTDSMFVELPGRTKAEAFAIGREIAASVSAMNPTPVELKFEKVYWPCLLISKKRYVGYMWERETDTHPVYDAKGIETVRRDGCALIRKILEKTICVWFATSDLSLVKSYLCKQWTKILNGRVSYREFIFAKEVKRPYRTEPIHSAAAGRMEKADTNLQILYGERVPYVMIEGANTHVVLRDLAYPPEQFLAHRHEFRLNSLYYIKHINRAVNRLTCLVGVDVWLWFEQLSPPRNRSLLNAKSHTAPTMQGFKRQTKVLDFFASTECIICFANCERVDGRHTRPNYIPNTPYRICNTCKRKPRALTLKLLSEHQRAEFWHQHLLDVCARCSGQGAFEDSPPCIQAQCPVHTEKPYAKDKVQHYKMLLKVAPSGIGGHVEN